MTGAGEHTTGHVPAPAPRMSLLRLGGVSLEHAQAICVDLASKDEERSGRAFEALVEIAAHFYAAGGRWSTLEWSALDQHERAACVRAAGEHEARAARRLAACVGLALKPGGAERMAAEFDGGEMLEQFSVDAVIDAAHARAVRIAEQARRGGT